MGPESVLPGRCPAVALAIRVSMPSGDPAVVALRERILELRPGPKVQGASSSSKSPALASVGILWGAHQGQRSGAKQCIASVFSMCRGGTWESAWGTWGSRPPRAVVEDPCLSQGFRQGPPEVDDASDDGGEQSKFPRKEKEGERSLTKVARPGMALGELGSTPLF